MSFLFLEYIYKFVITNSFMLKKTLIYMRNIYLDGFVSCSLYVGFDHFTENISRLESGGGVDILKLQKYRVSVAGVDKYLTLVGENHHYNAREFSLINSLVESHDTFANECGDCEFSTLSASDLTFLYALSIPLALTNSFYKLGSGRNYSTISDRVKSI